MWLWGWVEILWFHNPPTDIFGGYNVRYSSEKTDRHTHTHSNTFCNINLIIYLFFKSSYLFCLCRVLHEPCTKLVSYLCIVISSSKHFFSMPSCMYLNCRKLVAEFEKNLLYLFLYFAVLFCYSSFTYVAVAVMFIQRVYGVLVHLLAANSNMLLWCIQGFESKMCPLLGCLPSF